MHERPPTLHDRAWRLAYRLGFPLARVWWRVSRQPHEGALVALFVHDDLLLLRSSYRRTWNFPGGGIRPGEHPMAAARRELREEVGLDVPALMPGPVLSGVWEGRPDRVYFHELRLPALPPLRLDNREIVAARLFAPGELAGLAVTGAVAAYLRDRSAASTGASDAAEPPPS